jgi:SAM-dependent methyltransferase
MRKFFVSLYQLIIGKHPYNTIFSFNYHNIHHIVNFNKKLVKEQIVPKNSRLLDVGGGASPYYEIFKNTVKEYVVLDLVNALPEAESRKIIQVAGYAENLPFENESFEIILCNQALEHVNDDLKVLREIYRVLKKEGLFIGSAPHISPIHLEPFDYRRFTWFGIEKMLNDQHFKILKIEGNGGIYKTIAITLLTDWFLSENKGMDQKFNTFKHFILSPVTGFINTIALIADKVFKNKRRSASNYCWIAIK